VSEVTLIVELDIDGEQYVHPPLVAKADAIVREKSDEVSFHRELLTRCC
jgi:hypothetical protein